MENENLKKYLLGTLPDAESDELGLRLIDDEAFAEEVMLAEQELIEDYLEGSLSNDAEVHFGSVFLASPERKALLRETSLLKSYAKEELSLRPGSEPVPNSRERRFGDFFSFYFRPLFAAAAVVIIAISAGLIWNSYLRERPSPLETELSAMNTSDLSDLGQLANLYAVNLSSGPLRDASLAARHNADRLTEIVLFRLAMPPDTKSDSRYRAIIRRNDTADLKLASIPVYRNLIGPEVRFVLPRSSLQKGTYQIIIESASDNSVAGNYTFTVE